MSIYSKILMKQIKKKKKNQTNKKLTPNTDRCEPNTDTKYANTNTREDVPTTQLIYLLSVMWYIWNTVVTQNKPNRTKKTHKEPFNK